MKIFITDYEDHSEVIVRNNDGINIHNFVYDDKKAARAFVDGFRTCQTVINGMVQGLSTVPHLTKK